MGVNCDIVLFYGKDVGYKNVNYELFETEIFGKPGAKFNILFDGMSGNYAFVGKIITCFNSYHDDDSPDIQEITRLSEETENYIKKVIEEEFSQEPDCKYYLIRHYS